LTTCETPTSNTQVDELRKLEAHVARLTRLGYAGVVAALVVFAAYIVKFQGPLSSDPAAWGQFGDYLGGLLNPTFAFLALLALLATLGVQMRELRHSVRELANSAAALKSQNDTLRLQTFEGTFFQTLRLHNDIVLSMAIPERTLSGRACFRLYADELRGMLINQGATDNLSNAVDFYEHFYRSHQAALGHYFRLLYNLVKFVDAAPEVDHRFYTNLIRAQLSSAELLLLFYNCLSPHGSEKSKPLVEKYALLKTIPDDESLPHENLLEQYDVSAFGGRYPQRWM
jgi:Putative phage abortive infection protein